MFFADDQIFIFFLSITFVRTYKTILLTHLIKNTCLQVVHSLVNSFADLGKMV